MRSDSERNLPERTGDPTSDALALRSLRALAADKRIVVSSAGDGDYTSLAEATQAAPEGATVIVRPGLYEGIVEVERQMTIIGEGNASTIIVDGGEDHALLAYAPNVVVKGLRLRNDVEDFEQTENSISGGSTPAVASDEGSLELVGCLVLGGVYAANKSQVTLRRCTIHGGSAAVIQNSECLLLVEDSRIFDCQIGVAQQRGAVTVLRTSIEDCSFQGFGAQNGDEFFAEDCSVSGCRAGAAPKFIATASFKSVRFADCGFGLHLERDASSEYISAEDCSFERCTYGISGDGQLRIKGCKVLHCSDQGVALLSGSLSIARCHFQDNPSAILSKAVTEVRESTFHANSTAIVLMAAGGRRRQQGTIEQCEITNSADQGIFVHNCRAQISSSIFRECGAGVKAVGESTVVTLELCEFALNDDDVEAYDGAKVKYI